MQESSSLLSNMRRIEQIDSKQMLQQIAQQYKNQPNGGAIVAAALARAQQLDKLSNGMQAQQPPQPKVADQVIASMGGQGALPENQGIGQLPAENIAHMAGGGIVSFSGADGSWVTPDIAGGEKPPAPTDGISNEQRLALATSALAGSAAAIRQLSAIAPGLGYTSAMELAKDLVATAAKDAGGGNALRATRNALPKTAMGAGLPVLALGATAATGINTPTEDYRKRFGMETKDPSFAGDLGVRALGVASDLGNTMTMGLAAPLFRDKQELQAGIGTPPKKAPAAPAWNPDSGPMPPLDATKPALYSGTKLPDAVLRQQFEKMGPEDRAMFSMAYGKRFPDQASVFDLEPPTHDKFGRPLSTPAAPGVAAPGAGAVAGMPDLKSLMLEPRARTDFIAQRDKDITASKERSEAQLAGMQPPEDFAERKAALASMAQDFAKTKDEATGMAFLSAAQAMVNGRQGALQALVSGLAVGGKEYGAAMKDIRKSEQAQKMSEAMLKEAERAAKAGDYDKRQAILNRHADTVRSAQQDALKGIYIAAGGDSKLLGSLLETRMRGDTAERVANIGARNNQLELLQAVAQYPALAEAYKTMHPAERQKAFAEEFTDFMAKSGGMYPTTEAALAAFVAVKAAGKKFDSPQVTGAPAGPVYTR